MPFFHLSWSLCVEEHFYLVLPLLISLCVRLRIRWIDWAFLLVILTQILLRAAISIYGFRVLHLVDQGNIIAYLARIYYPTSCRFDGLTVSFIVTMLAVRGASHTVFTMVERPFLLLRDHRFAYQTPTESDLSRTVDQYTLPTSLLGNRQN
jgi:hypothetical protein